MQYQLLIVNRDQSGFIASVIGVPDCVAEGSTEEEAIRRAKAALNERLAKGKVVTIELETKLNGENPLLKHAGRFRDDPTFDDFLAEVEKYRRELDVEGFEEFRYCPDFVSDSRNA